MGFHYILNPPRIYCGLENHNAHNSLSIGLFAAHVLEINTNIFESK